MYEEYIELLKQLIAIPSFSRDEKSAADFLESWLHQHGRIVNRKRNNLWMCGEEIDDRPAVLLNAHIDTVKPASAYTRDPFVASIEDGKLYGLGSNDDGASLVALLAAYQQLSQTNQSYRLIFSATAEEEVSGKNGLELILPDLGPIGLGIMGEPTGMNVAVAERGLMVLDCCSYGKSGHAARNEGVNAIYEAMKDMEWFRTYCFDKVSEHLGPVKMSVTQINAGTQHNVVPDKCTFVVDVRSNGLYSNMELLSIVRDNVSCEVKERSTRLNSSHIGNGHPVVQKALNLGLSTFGSPTTSNQALVPFSTIKIGPGDSARSHSVDEYVFIEEIEQAVQTYVKLLDKLEL